MVCVRFFTTKKTAAAAFDAEAHKAGFKTVVEFVPAGSYSGLDDLSKTRKHWWVRLE